MRRKVSHLLARVAGVGLIVLVVWLVGVADRVTSVDGTEHRGRILERTDTQVRIETDAGVVEVEVRDARDVHEGLLTVLSNLAGSPGLALAGLALHILALACSFTRWGVLLKGADLDTPWPEVMRLNLIGQFSAAVLPGGNTVGDLVRAFYVARAHTGRKTRSIVTIFADRAIGLVVLCAIACAALLFAPAESKLSDARGVLLGVLVVLVAGLALLLSRRVRRLLRVDRLLQRPPFGVVLEELHLASEVYSRCKSCVVVAFVLSLVGQVFNLAAFYLYAKALGTTLPPLAVGVAIPVSLMVASVPLLPGGWGMGEFAFFFFLPATGVPAGVAVALSITQRTIHTLLALPGGLLLARARREEPLGAPGAKMAGTG